MQVTAVRSFTGDQQMLNLTVADTHTYYVMAGDAPVLVHNCGGSDPPNEALVQEIASRAERRIGGSGSVAGSKKHAYAAELLRRYQGIYGDRGLEVEQSYLNGMAVPNGTKGSARPDVFDTNTGIVYDYKFVVRPGRGLKRKQIEHNATHVPGAYLSIEVNP